MKTPNDKDATLARAVMKRWPADDKGWTQDYERGLARCSRCSRNNVQFTLKIIHPQISGESTGVSFFAINEANCGVRAVWYSGAIRDEVLSFITAVELHRQQREEAADKRKERQIRKQIQEALK
ncbi:MAG: hypothetical protein WC107_07360 [Patescibacteria group bacterium]